MKKIFMLYKRFNKAQWIVGRIQNLQGNVEPLSMEELILGRILMSPSEGQNCLMYYQIIRKNENWFDMRVVVETLNGKHNRLMSYTITNQEPWKVWTILNESASQMKERPINYQRFNQEKWILGWIPQESRGQYNRLMYYQFKNGLIRAFVKSVEASNYKILLYKICNMKEVMESPCKLNRMVLATDDMILATPSDSTPYDWNYQAEFHPRLPHERGETYVNYEELEVNSRNAFVLRDPNETFFPSFFFIVFCIVALVNFFSRRQ